MLRGTIVRTLFFPPHAVGIRFPAGDLPGSDQEIMTLRCCGPDFLPMWWLVSEVRRVLDRLHERKILPQVGYVGAHSKSGVGRTKP